MDAGLDARLDARLDAERAIGLGLKRLGRGQNTSTPQPKRPLESKKGGIRASRPIRGLSIVAEDALEEGKGGSRVV